MLAIVLPVAILVFTSLLPFYEGLTWEFVRPLHVRQLRDAILGPGSFRDAIGNTLMLGIATATASGAVRGALRLARGAALSAAAGCSIRSP